MICVYATASTSGGHLNPAVSIAQVFSGSKMSWKKFSGYVGAQLLGAVCAACILKFMLGGPVFTTTGSLGADVSATKRIFIWELFGTFALAYVVLTSTAEKGAQQLAPFAIGMTLAADIFAFGRFTGGSMNPVRTLGPAVAFWKFGNAFWYCVAQLLGGMAAAFVNEKFDESEESTV